MNIIIKLIVVFSLIAGAIGIENYIALRWIVFSGLIYLIYQLVDNDNKTEVEVICLYVYIGIALLFNPIIPIYLYDRGLWVVLDLLSAVFILFVPYIDSKNIGEKGSRKNNSKERSFIEEYEGLTDYGKRKYINSKMAYDDARIESIGWEIEQKKFMDEVCADAMDIVAEFMAEENYYSSKDNNENKVENKEEYKEEYKIEIIYIEPEVLFDTLIRNLTVDDDERLSEIFYYSSGNTFPKNIIENVVWKIYNTDSGTYIGCGWLSSYNKGGTKYINIIARGTYKGQATFNTVNNMLEDMEKYAKKHNIQEISAQIEYFACELNKNESIKLFFSRGYRLLNYSSNNGEYEPLSLEKTIIMAKEDTIFLKKKIFETHISK